jgi:predicted secreted protein
MAKGAAFGTSFKITGGTVVGNIHTIKGPGVTLSLADVTSHDSTGGWREKVATLLEGGPVNLGMHYDPANAQIKNAAGGLLYLMTTRASANFTITMPGGAAIIFQGFVTNFNPDMPHDGALGCEVEVTPTGPVTLP